MAKRKKRKQLTPKDAAKAWSILMKLLTFRAPVHPPDARSLAKCTLAISFIPETKSKKLNSSKRSSGHAAEVENIAYRFCGFPDEDQAKRLSCNIGAARWMWNRLKADRDTLWKEMGITVRNTPAEYKDLDECEWLKEVDSSALCNVQLAHERAYNEFFNGTKGFPRFKKKHVCKASYTTSKDKRCDNIKLENGRLTLPRVPGTIRLKAHRDIPSSLTIKSCTICHEPDGHWTFTILCEYAAEEPTTGSKLEQFLRTGDASVIRHIGLDMSFPEMYVDSDGCVPSYTVNDVLVGFRKCYRQLESRIAREQKKLSHMVRDSGNYAKQCIKIAKLHAKAKHQRNDFLHQVAVRLAREYDVISIEDLDIGAMKQSLKFGKSVSDNGWGTFVSILEEKCTQYGCILIKVSRWFPSSKTCSHCGYVHKELKLSDRTYICPKCGHIMGRDHQAAINIDLEGLRLLLELYGEPAAEAA